MFTVALLVLFSILCILLSGDGAWDNVTKPERNELVFEGRPKDYGAFVLRREYSRRFILAFSGALTVVSLAVIVPKVMAMMNGTPTTVPISNTTVVDVMLNEIFDVPKEKPEPEAAKTAPPAPTPTPAAIPVIVDSALIDVKPDTASKAAPPDTSSFVVAKGPIGGDPGNKKPGGGDTGGGGGTGTGTPVRGETLAHAPQFPGGEAAMYEFVKDHIHFPDDAMEVSEKIYVEFVIEEDGSISMVTVVKGNHPSLKREAARVVRAMPRWSPGRMDDHAVRCRLVLPINFTVSQ